MNSAKPTAISIAPREFHRLEPLRDKLNADGRLEVPTGYDDFVIYGPYWPMQAGLYLVQPCVEADNPEETLGILEICDRGEILSSTELRAGTVLTANLPKILGLEIRIKANGAPFALQSVILAHWPSDPPPSEASTKNEITLRKVDAFLDQIDEPKADRNHLAMERREFLLKAKFDLLAEAIHKKLPGLVDAVGDGPTVAHDLEAWLSQRDPVQLIDAWGEHLAENAETLVSAGFDIASIRLMSSDRPGLAAQFAYEAGLESAARQLAREPSIEYDQSSGLVLQSELRRVQGGFSKLAASTGRAFVTCPFTGARLSTRHALAIPNDSIKQVSIFYRFESIEIFYIITAGFSGGKAFFYCPSKNIVLRLYAPLFEWGLPQTMLDGFYRLALPRAAQVIEYLSSPTERAVISGTLNNVGHFFWNEASGVENFAEGKYLDGILHGLLYKYAYIDPFELLNFDLLPLRAAYRTEETFFEAILEKRLFCVRPVGSSITPAIAGKIHKLAIAKSSKKQCDLATEARQAKYLLWAAVRNHNKVWVNQVDGILAVVQELVQKYGSVALFIDGMPDCQAYLDEIQRRAPAGVKIYIGIDISMYETLMWAFQVDSYIATIGSGLTFVTWIAAKPGIAHAETHHLSQMGFWGDVRSDAPMPLTPAPSEVTDLGERDYCNYSIPPEVILRLFRQLSNTG